MYSINYGKHNGFREDAIPLPTEGVPSPEQLEDLNQEYKKLVPMYVQLLTEYEEASRRAANSRNNFPWLYCVFIFALISTRNMLLGYGRAVHYV
jgi:hypothetical protein